jgi:hypothetical protein
VGKPEMSVKIMFIKWKMIQILILIIIIIKMGAIIGLIIGIVDHNIEIIILIVLLHLEACHQILTLITLTMGDIRIIQVGLCPRILLIKIKVGPKCLMVTQTKACQTMEVKFQVGLTKW